MLNLQRYAFSLSLPYSKLNAESFQKNVTVQHKRIHSESKKIIFPTNSINVFIIHKVEETGCQRVHGIKRHKKTNNTVSVPSSKEQ